VAASAWSLKPIYIYIYLSICRDIIANIHTVSSVYIASGPSVGPLPVWHSHVLIVAEADPYILLSFYRSIHTYIYQYKHTTVHVYIPSSPSVDPLPVWHSHVLIVAQADPYVHVSFYRSIHTYIIITPSECLLSVCTCTIYSIYIHTFQPIRRPTPRFSDGCWSRSNSRRCDSRWPPRIYLYTYSSIHACIIINVLHIYRPAHPSAHSQFVASAWLLKPVHICIRLSIHTYI